jgi:putative N-acylglucosamine-6-phosphate 2-epimerase
MPIMAKAAVEGGAVGIRALYDDVDAIKKVVNVPVIGLVKRNYQNCAVYITPTEKEVDLVLATRADCLAIDATSRPRPGGIMLKDLVAYVRSKKPDVELMADVDTLENAIRAEEIGFDYISTTLRGYTEETRGIQLPDIDFLAEVIKRVKRSKVIAEGGIFETGELEKINRINPYAVVIGSAVTRPAVITKRFVKALRLGERV